MVIVAAKGDIMLSGFRKILILTTRTNILIDILKKNHLENFNYADMNSANVFIVSSVTPATIPKGSSVSQFFLISYTPKNVLRGVQ